MIYLSVDQLVSKDVWEEQESFVLRIVYGGSRDINVDTVDGGFLAWIRIELWMYLPRSDGTYPRAYPRA